MSAVIPVAIPSPRLAAAHPVFTALPPLALYVHVPWCVKKCPYCDFNSHELRGELQEDAYVNALLADLETTLPSIWGRKVHAIFIGGGTPSLLSERAIDALLAGIRARITVIPGAEVTLEANPGTFERARFAGYFAAGVNRVSLGVQSFDPAKLQALGRIHNAHDARRAAEAAMMIFGNVNLDLMFALPGQTMDELDADLAAALAFGTPHLSLYQLTLEPNTLFHRYPPALPDADVAADMQDHVEARLAAAGYMRYEVSAYAQPGGECAHNLNYWRFGDYVGIGAGAHGKLSFADRIERTVRYKQPTQYLAQVAVGTPMIETRTVGVEDLGFEFMLNALRLTAGVPTTLFAERCGVPLATIAAPLAEAATRGLLDRDPTMIRATPLGRRFLNDLTELFLAA
ncbi:MAG: oxygen-independent coproporphyrinogen III oxidase-like protein [Proteobacteria bacterium]|nr:oxygen-independent coproporphyrinogen III oxidase-like protein [Pseudomonadota bacterium]